MRNLHENRPIFARFFCWPEQNFVPSLPPLQPEGHEEAPGPDEREQRKVLLLTLKIVYNFPSYKQLRARAERYK